MKITFFLLLFPVLSVNIFAQDEPVLITSYTNLLTVLDNGHSVNAVFHYGKCRLMVDSVEEKSPDVKGGMQIDEYEIFPAGTIRNPKGFIAFSKTVLISHSRYGYVWNYVKCRIYEDNKVEINARYLSPQNYETKMNETFYGELSSKNEDKGVFLYLD